MPQLTIDFQAARKRGHEAAEAAANRAGDKWIDDAVEVLQRFARYYGTEPFTVEQARKLWDFPPAPDQRAWGHVTRKAVALGYIKRLTGQYATDSYGSPKSLYIAA